MDHLRGNHDDLQDTLRRTLGRVEDEVGRILDGSFEVLDHERLLDALDEQAEDLCRALEHLDRLGGDGGGGRDPSDLNAIAEATLSRQLDALQFPIVVQTSWSDDTPLLAMSADSLGSLLVQVIRQSLRFAGSGGALQLATAREADQALLTVEATRGDGDEMDPAELAARFESVDDFVGGYGGGTRIDTDEPGRLRLELLLPLGIEIA